MGGEGDPLGIVQEIEMLPYEQVVYSPAGIRPGKWDAEISLGLSDTSRIRNLSRRLDRVIVKKRNEKKKKEPAE